MTRSSCLAMETCQELTTPAFVFDLDLLEASARRVREVTDQGGCRLLFSVKACVHRAVLQRLLPFVDGFACSAPFEARWAKENALAQQTIHCTAPGPRPCDLEELVGTCHYLSFNSLTQYRSAVASEDAHALFGLRINPEHSLVSDARYDPCRKYSKLGIPLDEFAAILTPDRRLPAGITGLHIHTNCDCHDIGELRETVQRLDQQTGDALDQCAWVNLGGGYLYDRPEAGERLADCREILTRGRDIEVFTEPGAGVVNDCGFLVTSVVDLLERNGRSLALLDTTINHLPEVFEYDLVTEVVGANPGQGPGHAYFLAGASCLAGDLFGEYTFAEPLQIGQRIILAKVGAYTLVKAHMFNGICLPGVYTYSTESGLTLEYQTNYQDFMQPLQPRIELDRPKG